MRIEGDDLIFSSGKTIYANQGIVGIDSEGYITEGYDGGIDDDKFTPDEKMEFADYMIGLWRSYKNKQEASFNEKS